MSLEVDGRSFRESCTTLLTMISFGPRDGDRILGLHNEHMTSVGFLTARHANEKQPGSSFNIFTSPLSVIVSLKIFRSCCQT